MATRRGYWAHDKAGFAIRAYIVNRRADAERAAQIELGPTFGRLTPVMMCIVENPTEPMLIPADLTKNSGWAELSTWDAE